METQTVIPKQQPMSEPEVVLPEKQESLQLTSQERYERLLQISIERGGSAESFAVLVDAIMKARKEDARLAFEAALGRFKNDLPTIFKSKKVSFPNKDGSKTEYSHAELCDASELVADSLKKYGLTHHWKPGEGANGRTLVTCIFRHPETGHVEEMATLGAPPDTSGAKNSVQAIGSSTTYLERYTLLAAAGIVAKGMDDDGRSAEGMAENAVTDYCVQMQDASKIGPSDEKGTLQSIFKECYDKANKMADKSARDRFIKVYEQRKKALRQL